MPIFNVQDLNGYVNTITASKEFVERYFPNRWEQLPEKTQKTSQTHVTRRQARQALLLAGYLDDIPNLISNIEDDTQRRLAQIEWEDATEFERYNPTVLLIAQGLGLTDTQLDELFAHAATL